MTAREAINAGMQGTLDPAHIGEPITVEQPGRMEQFATGATRSNDADALDYEGFLSPLALRRFAEYMHQHRRQADGGLRSSDNWQKGMPVPRYMKSMFRHFMDVWALYRRGWPASGQGADPIQAELEEALCALQFNVQGMLHEVIKLRPR